MSVKVTQNVIKKNNRLVFVANIYYSDVLHAQGRFMVPIIFYQECNSSRADDSSRNWQVSLSTSNIRGRSGFQWSNIRLQKFPLVTSLIICTVILLDHT